MRKAFFHFSVILGLYFLVAETAHADMKITRIPGNAGRVETAHFSVGNGKIFVVGRVKLWNWSDGPISVRVDLKDAAGRVIASKTGRSYPSGRRQTVAAFGVPFGVSFDQSVVRNLAAVDVTCGD